MTRSKITFKKIIASVLFLVIPTLVSAAVGSFTYYPIVPAGTNFCNPFSAPSLAFDGTNMWSISPAFNQVCKVTPTGGWTVYPGLTGIAPTSIAFDGINMWVANKGNTASGNGSVSKINVSTGTSVTSAMTGYSPVSIAFDGTNMWTVNQYTTTSGVLTVSKIAPTGAVLAVYALPGTVNGNALSIAFDGTNMWVSDSWNGVYKISPTGVVTGPISLGVAVPTAIAFDGVNMWVAGSSNNYYIAGSVSKISPAGVVTTYAIPGASYASPMGIAFDGTNMWTVNYLGATFGSVTRITPAGMATTYAATQVSPRGGIAFNKVDSMWVSEDAGLTKVTAIASYYLDIGLHVSDGVTTYHIAAEPLGTVTSKLRISKGGTTYGIVLVPTTDPMATKFRINTSAGVMALRKL